MTLHKMELLRPPKQLNAVEGSSEASWVNSDDI